MAVEVPLARSDPSFSDWIRPDLLCHEQQNLDHPSRKDVAENRSCTHESYRECSETSQDSTATTHHPSYVKPAQLRHAVKRSFQLLQVSENWKHSSF